MTNSYKPTQIAVKGTAVWSDAENQDKVRPSKITVRLLADGKPIKEEVVSEENGWQYNFSDLPKYKDGKEIVYISEYQVEHFLGNAIELINNENVKICVMSATAYSVLTDEQKNIIEKYDVIVPVDVHTIERYGGGSARCMIAELFI